MSRIVADKIVAKMAREEQAKKAKEAKATKAPVPGPGRKLSKKERLKLGALLLKLLSSAF